MTSTNSGRDTSARNGQSGGGEAWDHGTNEGFYKYYADQSISKATLHRFCEIRDTVLRLLGNVRPGAPLDVADIGCGAGTQCRLWAELGHRVIGLDVNEPLIELGRMRAHDEGLAVEFKVGSATKLPLADASLDVCLVPELLEHVADWQSCLNEFARVLRPGGVLYLSTSNKLCPFQDEFSLPLYSWYPGIVKKHYEKLALTTRPEIANYAKYPAVNWFSFFALRDYLTPLGFDSLDRFDLIDMQDKSRTVKAVCTLIRAVPGLRFLAHVATPYIVMISIKRRLT